MVSTDNTCAGYLAHPSEFLGNGDAKSLKIGYHAGQSGNRYVVDHMIKALIPSLKRFVNRVKLYLKQWSKPGTASIAVGTLIDLRRSRRDLIVENAMLRQQLIVLHRQVKQPHLTQGHRLLMILLARMTGYWQQALHIVQPDTLLRWHRDLFRFYWRLKSKRKQSKPKIPSETVDLIQSHP